MPKGHAINAIILDLLEAAKVAIQPGGRIPDDPVTLITALLAVVEKEMPVELKERDARIVRARAFLAALDTEP